MTNVDKAIQALLDASKKTSKEERVAAIMAIGESGMIENNKLVNVLLEDSKKTEKSIRIAAITALGNMLKNSNRQ